MNLRDDPSPTGSTNSISTFAPYHDYSEGSLDLSTTKTAQATCNVTQVFVRESDLSPKQLQFNYINYIEWR